jgi:hypothetical protein
VNSAGKGAAMGATTLLGGFVAIASYVLWFGLCFCSVFVACVVLCDALKNESWLHIFIDNQRA